MSLVFQKIHLFTLKLQTFDDTVFFLKIQLVLVTGDIPKMKKKGLKVILV